MRLFGPDPRDEQIAWLRSELTSARAELSAAYALLAAKEAPRAVQVVAAARKAEQEPIVAPEPSKEAKQPEQSVLRRGPWARGDETESLESFKTREQIEAGFKRKDA